MSRTSVPILSARDVCKRFGERVLFDGVKLALESGERVGVVGVNGSGKTTLARILAGVEQPDAGEIVRGRGIRLGYLAQDPDMPESATAMEVVLSGMPERARAIARHAESSAAIARGPGDDAAALVRQQAEAAAEVERLGGWELDHLALAVLSHLGVSRPDAPVGPMSGGERRRVALSRLLVAGPDIAILDEPTNHLDIPTIEWLESYLCDRFRGAIVLITHDRYLLDRVVTRTLEVDAGSVYSYRGGWESFLAAKEERHAHEMRAQANRKNALRRELEWLRRQPKARTTRQKARTNRLKARAEATDGRVERERRVNLVFEGARSGHTVLDAEDVAVEVAGHRLVNGLTLRLGKRERIGIVGPNGCGKTSLLRVLLGEVEPAEGRVRVGANTRVAYLDQLRSNLDENLSILEWVADGRSHVRVGDRAVSVHAYLERFMFPPRMQTQKIRTLSGGERARVALARLLCDSSNLVVLDEPTNDLDVTTLSALEDALTTFDGSVLCVTHDRFFLDRVATSILSFEAPDRPPARAIHVEAGCPAKIVHVHGNYQSYLEYRAISARETADADAPPRRGKGERPTRPSPSPSPTSGSAARPLTYGEEIELAGLPDDIDRAEAVVAALEAELEQAALDQRDHTEQAALFERLAQAKAAADALVERWADLESRKSDA